VKKTDLARLERKCRTVVGADARGEVRRAPRQSTAAAAKARSAERELKTSKIAPQEYPPPLSGGSGW
jgi:hypothetical protein